MFYMPTQAMAASIEIEGINISSTTRVEGQTLQLNGAGFRSIFLMDIYLISLYLTHPSENPDSIMQIIMPVRRSLLTGLKNCMRQTHRAG